LLNFLKFDRFNLNSTVSVSRSDCFPSSFRAIAPSRRVRSVAVALCSFLPLAGHASDPTADQQYWLELINRMRLDPASELQRIVNFSAPGVWAAIKSRDPSVQIALDFYGSDAATLQSQWSGLSPAPALAWNSLLSDSAATYSNRMAQEKQQSHTLDGLSLPSRIQASGYTSDYLEVGESLFAATQNTFHGHSALAIDWGDDDADPNNGFGNGIQTPPLHREVMMDRLFKEIGIGTVTTPVDALNGIGPQVVTQHFASQFRFAGGQYISDAIVTGVVYADTWLADDFYTPGEGIANAMIEVWDTFSATLITAGTTNAAGGFNLITPDLMPGRTYAIRAPSSGLNDVTFTASATIEDYGAPVTVFDNAYARFQTIPEPGSAVFTLLAFVLLSAAPRLRPKS